MNDADPSQIFKEFQNVLEQYAAADARNPNYQRLGAGYATRCQEWARRDLWTLDEAANLLCGTDPRRPFNVKGPDHGKLNDEVQAMRQLLTRANIPKQGRQLIAKELIPWAKAKGLAIPDELLAATGQRPPIEKPVHGNALKNAERRQQVLGAAIAALIKYPAQCKDRGEKPTGTQIAKVLEQQQTNLFADGVAPLSIRTMAELINEYLPK